jgi:phosphatidylserine decarboxylase
MEEIIKFLTPRISKDGYPIIAASGVIAVLGLMFFDKLGILLLIGFVFCVYFFRDPERVTPIDKNFVVSPADGVVSAIERNVQYPEELGVGDKVGTRVSIFLNVFNVHVNRIPVSGIVVKESYRPGKFINASLDKSSKDNERQSVLINTIDGKEVAVVQIAGLIARRIISRVKDGDNVNCGTRYGIIKFGSRLDVFLPESIEPQVLIGQTMVGGETLIANLSGEQKVLESSID